jgi:AmmeMemoRadiSam system protein B/AmmeMemoRadiSam system protein A
VTRFIYLILLFFSFFTFAFADSIKEPNVAGGFYSADPKELSQQIDTFLAQASVSPIEEKIQAIIAPHAGYEYSGPVAAYDYKAISRQKYSTVVIIGPSHFFPFEGISVWSEGGFKTPLGVANIDTEFAQKLIDAGKRLSLPLGSLNVFEKEHSVEVEIPFIQKTFGNGVKIVPILMGNPDPQVCQKLALILNQLVGSRDDVLIIASSDMSHYFPYETANKMDAATLKAIGEENPEKLWNGCLITHEMEMCGVVPVTTVLLYAKERGLKVRVLNHANSGDTTGDKSKVVGYSSVIFYTDKSQGAALTDSEKKELRKLAKDTLNSFVTTGKAVEEKTNDIRLVQTQGAFVTLRKKGELRGCIGHIIGDQPLWQTVHDMTIDAASKDPRFSPVVKDELKDIDIEISVLSVPQHVPNASAITLGKDGVIVSDGHFHEGVFLPQVASETHWSKEEFLSELCSQKAGLPSNCWKDPHINLWTFQADVF